MINQEQYSKLKQVIQEANKDICIEKKRFFVESFRSSTSAEKWIGDFQNVVSAEIIPIREHESYIVCWVKVEVLSQRPIRLADVLLACENVHTGEHGIRVDIGYNLAKIAFDIEKKFCWNLKDDDLDNQSDETKQFLIDLLVK